MIAFIEQDNVGQRPEVTTATADFSALEKGALAVRKHNDELAALANELGERITAAKRELMPKIRRALDKLNVSSAELLAEVMASRHLFQEPKTQVFHGVKLGWPKARGGLEIPDAARTIERAEKLLTASQFKMVVKTTHELRKKPLGTLDVDTLKKLGVNIRNAGEYALVSISDGEVAEMVRGMLREEGER